MADRSDYTKSRTNLLDLQSDTFNSEVNKSLVENTFNRFLAKDETVEVIGTIGEQDESARVDRQIPEDTVHRRGYQLQPLVHHKIATVDYASSSEDILNELSRLGVDVSRFPKWGDTERFNFAPPVDLDKLINYTDYYWYDPNGTHITPQYVVMKTACSTYTSRLAQKMREVAGIGDSNTIFNVLLDTNEIVVPNNVTAGFAKDVQFDIVDSMKLNGQYVVESVDFRDGFTYIIPTVTLPNASYGGGRITFDSTIRQLTQDKNMICDGSSGWDSASWDDNAKITDDGLVIGAPMTLELLKDTSFNNMFAMVIERDTNLVRIVLNGIDKGPILKIDINNNIRAADVLGITFVNDPDTIVEVEYDDIEIVTVEAKPLWQWLDQPKPEFIHKWDRTGSAQDINDWQAENKWIHKLDLPVGSISNSIRASAPIIEYIDRLEMNEWSYTSHRWMYRADPIRDKFEEVDFEPTDSDYFTADPKEFLDHWIYLGPSDPVPINHQPENPNAVLMALDSKRLDYKLEPFIAERIIELIPYVVQGQSGPPMNRMAYKISLDFPLNIGDRVVFHTMTMSNKVANRDKLISEVEIVGDYQVIYLSDALTDVVFPGDYILINAGTRPFNATMFKSEVQPDHWTTALAGQQNTRVYIDGREQIGNYVELLYQSPSGVYMNGVVFDTFISQQSTFEVGIGPSAAVDSNRGIWNVRTVEFIDDQEFRDARVAQYDKIGTFLGFVYPTTTISPIRYRYHQQRKKIGVTKFPIFDIYHPSGETAYRANEIFKFVTDQSARVESSTGLRLKRSDNGRTFHFKQLLIEYDGGPIFCYKDLDIITSDNNGLCTIWKTSNDVRYVPRYVNENRREDGDEYYTLTGKKMVDVVEDGEGDWEIPSQLYNNSSHENRIEITSIELMEHVKTILRAQADVVGFKPNKQYGHRLLDRIDFGVGGTIHEHNDSWDLMVSTLFSSVNSPIDVLDFAATSYETALSEQEEFILAAAYDSLMNTSIEYLGDLKGSMIKSAIEQYEFNDNNNLLFGDSSSFINGKGVNSWPATAPMLGLQYSESPNLLSDPKLEIYEIHHHDGHYSRNKITKGDVVGVAKRLIRATHYDVDKEQTRLKGWTPTQAAVGTIKYASNTDIPLNDLYPGDCWLDGTTFKRFEVVAIGAIAPSIVAPIGSTWYDTVAQQLMTRVDDDLIPWVPMTINGARTMPGDYVSAWSEIDLTEILNELILNIENRLVEAVVEHNHRGIKFTDEQFIQDQEDRVLHEELLDRAFMEYAVKRQIVYPYASVYVQNNPFTWNYKGVDSNQRDDSDRLINIWSPFEDARDVKWSGTWAGVYKNVFGTYYPHLEPWVLQGYASKPTWWDAEYADTTGTRRWKDSMWTNVVANRVNAIYDAPTEHTIELDSITGTLYRVMVKKFNYVPVNTQRPISSKSGAVLYNVDDLFPLYDSRILEQDNIDIANESSIGKPMIRRPEAVNSVNLKSAYSFGDDSPIELQWKKSTQYRYDLLKIAFLMQPMRFLHYTWGNEYVNVNGLQVNVETDKVFAHHDTIFHGDVIDGKTYKSIGINQWYVNYIRSSGIDFKVSNVRELWTGWTAKMAYQFGGFINTKSFGIRTGAFDLIKEDYRIFSKKSPGYESKWVDGINVTVANYGQFQIKNGSRVPLGDGSDWTFNISLPANQPRIVKYFGTRRYTFVVVDEAQGILQLNEGQVPWDTGDIVYADSSGYLPFPMDQVYTYYAIRIPGQPHMFKLSRSAGGAHRGEFIELRTSGEGVQYIAETQSTFYAYGTESSDIEWKHHILDTNVVKELAAPFVIQGIQGLIDFVDGYAEYKRHEGFVFNDSTSKELDYNTARLMSWQTEIERAIDIIYSGLGKNNTSVKQYGNVYEIELVDLVSNLDTFKVVDGTAPFQYGDAVFVYTTGSMPTGLSMNTVYFIIPSEVEGSSEFKLASTAQNAYDEIAINIATPGIGKLTITKQSDSVVAVDDVVEINPFRYNLWVNTPEGIVADVFTGGDSYNAGEVLIYDQYGRPLPKGSVLVFRNDKITHVNVRSTMLNDVIVNNTQPTPYNLLHLGGMKVYVDGFEHVVLFNDYMTNGQMVYDGYIGMNIPRFSVDFQRTENRNLRPNVGGYFLHDNEMVRNIESHVSDMRNYYRTHDVNEHMDYVPHARALLGYEDPVYLDHLNTPKKSKFSFWKGMIQRKGSRNAVNSFINSEHFVDAKVDEFWAYKLCDFGDAREMIKPKVRVLVSDAYNNDIRFEFSDPIHTTPNPRFTQIALTDQTRWVDLPSIRKSLNGINMAFNAKSVTTVVNVNTLPTTINHRGTARLLVIDRKMWGVKLQYSENDIWKTLELNSSGIGMERPNDRVVLLYGVDTISAMYVTGQIPDVDKLDPIELIDQHTGTTVLRTKYWNPINGKHYHVPLKSIDYQTPTDPTNGQLSDWTDNKLGWMWLDESSLGYLPYDDETIYPEVNDRMERWGRVAEWSEPKVYEWVRSTMDPIQYVEKEEGEPLEMWTKLAGNGEYVEVDIRPIHSMYDHSQAFADLATLDQRMELYVYINGAKVDNTQYNTLIGDVLGSDILPIDQYGIQASDYVTFIVKPSQDLINDEEYRQDYKFLKINEKDSPVYYFWVANRKVRGAKHSLSANEIVNQLIRPQTPYHMFLKFYESEVYQQAVSSDESGTINYVAHTLPARFTEVLIKDIAPRINSDNRYVIQFTRFFNLRDDLDSGNSPLDLKNNHSEWYMFRREQPNKIPSQLWNKMVESLVGYSLVGFDVGELTPVPSLERVIYDATYNTTTRFGLDDGQAFVDRAIGIASVERLVESATFDTTPVDKYAFLDEHSFDTPLNIKNAMDYMFVNFSSKAVNTMFFELLQDALASKRDYSGLLKTSFIALHGIKILETAGNVTE